MPGAILLLAKEEKPSFSGQSASPRLAPSASTNDNPYFMRF